MLSCIEKVFVAVAPEALGALCVGSLLAGVASSWEEPCRLLLAQVPQCSFMGHCPHRIHLLLITVITPVLKMNPLNEPRLHGTADNRAGITMQGFRLQEFFLQTSDYQTVEATSPSFLPPPGWHIII